uniref:Dynein light chain n=1 Tax=Fibrocapsa japonica TaxID=94617 RepID=A0A6U1NWB1_9STRA|mmetsp:Transcript_23040/g.33432  ORF Transcript_23040/g.33432 Transcript_23040/m.33432 type:complete len:121 (+) Transcript_23040:125-487(+)|eukprot:CAMPEP_0113934922 /NCGR_PEP_ID=MMETSP1339-20121228/2173_1 /TAXON_ID=94617 /ORGANISM="Fibrocapsa japonica" /LENGTH=120 /DNA_ID=CAMNT_0000936899 /DNA_START=108 /DNA_END=473 /DNA_ORIENTATION=+ /assembly_acc=CAM_ASM_000762
MEFQDDAAEFSQEDVETTAKNAIRSCLDKHNYQAKKVDDWTNTIVDTCLKELQSMNRPYKYVVTCIIMQKNGAGMNTTASMFWDTTKDGLCKVYWENHTIHCIVTVFGLAVHIDNQNELD